MKQKYERTTQDRTGFQPLSLCDYYRHRLLSLALACWRWACLRALKSAASRRGPLSLWLCRKLRSPLPLQFAHELPVIELVEPPPAADAAYVVQAASFRGRDEAAKLTGDLTQRGYAAGIFDFKDPAGRSWWIVRVGPYAVRAEASQAASELGRFTRSEPIVRLEDN